MPPELLAALLGALVAFSGTYLLQRAQFRRADLDGVRERVGLVRGLRADLYVSKLLCEGAIRSQAIAPGVQCPVDLWVSSGHRIIAAVRRPAEEALIDAFGRLRAINGTWNAMPGAVVKTVEEHDEKAGVLIEPENILRMIEKIDAAVAILDRLESEYEERECRLRHPVRACLPWRQTGGVTPDEPTS